jgi:hypothetical protein
MARETIVIVCVCATCTRFIAFQTVPFNGFITLYVALSLSDVNSLTFFAAFVEVEIDWAFALSIAFVLEAF